MDNSRFDEAAETWDAHPRRTERSVLFAERLTDFIQANDYKTGMDFGAGTGITSFVLSDQLEAITLIDYSQGMVAEINRKLEAKRVTNLNAQCLDLLDPQVSLPYTFDIIYSIMTFHHIHDTDRLLQVVHQYLNPGGMIVVVDLDSEDGSFHHKYPDFDGHLGFDRKDLSEKMRIAGFENRTAEDFYTVYKDEDLEKKRPYPLFLMTAQKPL